MIHHLHTTNTPIFIIPCKQSTIIRMNNTRKYNLTQHHHTWLFKYFHETSKAWLISRQSFKVSWFESIGLAGNGFVPKKNLLMELQTWVDFMELWTNLICSWIGSATCNFTTILRKEDMGTNFQRSWEKKTWAPICRELKKNNSWTKKIHGNPFT